MTAYVIYSENRHSDALIQALTDMTTKANFAPSQKLCSFLLDNALEAHDAKVLTILATWFLHNFKDRLDHGVISNMIMIATYKGMPALAELGHKVSSSNFRHLHSS
jgi:hypothetical protein